MFLERAFRRTAAAIATAGVQVWPPLTLIPAAIKIERSAGACYFKSSTIDSHDISFRLAIVPDRRAEGEG